MGVLNVTPDSFYDGGQYFSPRKALDRGLELEEEGADILDIGGESTRPPHCKELPAAEELRRVLPVIEGLRKRLRIPVSIDTYKAEVARSALEAGAEIVNDVGGLKFDRRLAHVVAAARAGIVIVHSRGGPTGMHHVSRSGSVLRTVVQGLEQSIRLGRLQGIPHSRMILDPGIGFSKSAAESVRILGNLPLLKRFQLPILVGASRKSFLGQILDLPVGERLQASLAAAAAAVLNGAHIVRVHDVKETRQVVRICDAIRQASGSG